MALRDSMLKSRANPLKFRLRIRWSSSCVITVDGVVVDPLPDSSISVTGALLFSCFMCASWNMTVVIISTSTYEWTAFEMR